MQIELQIILGLNCNFRCRHCLNGSSPGNKASDISQVDIDSIKYEIERNQNIECVSFSGGEPLLYLSYIEKIVLFCRGLRRDKPITFSITTNGSLISKFQNELKKINIDHCTISYDQSHSEYLDQDSVIKNLRLSKSLFCSLEINFVYQDFSELKAVESIGHNENVKINFNEQIYSGRSVTKGSRNHTALETIHCPNMPQAGKVKISFFPNRGYSICCGPVVFDNLSDDKTKYSESINEVQNTLLFKLMEKLSTRKINTTYSLDCDKCRAFFSKLNEHQEYRDLYEE